MIAGYNRFRLAVMHPLGTRAVLIVCLFGLLAGCESGPEWLPQPGKWVSGLSGDKSQAPEEEPQVLSDKGSSYKVGQPYYVNGQWYYPSEDEDYDKTGTATWRGPEFEGNETASGEVFRVSEYHAAHATLPMPVLAKITNLENKREVTVRINDRGAYAPGILIEVSQRVADELGFSGKGYAKVRVQYAGLVEPPPADPLVDPGADMGADPALDPEASSETELENAPVTDAVREEAIRANPVSDLPVNEAVPEADAMPTDDPMGEIVQQSELAPVRGEDTAVSASLADAGALYVQIGSYKERGNADQVSQRVSAFGEAAAVVEAVINGEQFYRVRLGPISDAERANALREQVSGIGYPSAMVLHD